MAWGLIAGAVWLAINLAGDPGWMLPAIAGCYLVVLLASVCTIDDRYGIIPDSMVLGTGRCRRTVCLVEGRGIYGGAH